MFLKWMSQEWFSIVQNMSSTMYGEFVNLHLPNELLEYLLNYKQILKKITLQQRVSSSNIAYDYMMTDYQTYLWQ